MRLALLWALGLLGAGSPLPFPSPPGTGGAKEEQAIPEKTLSAPREPQVLQDNLTLSLAEVLQTSLPETLRIKLELDGESHVLELQQNRELVPGHPTVVWYQPDGTRVVSEGHTLENCCYQGGVRGRADAWASVCTCSGLRGLVILSPEESYSLELRPGDLRGPPIVSRIQHLPLPGHACTLSSREPERPLGQRHVRRRRRDVVTETKIIELMVVADHSEVQRYPDFQYLLNRTLEVALLLDTFFRPLNVRVALVGLEAWTQEDLVEISQDPGVTLDNFLRWRRTSLLPRLPHDSAQLVTATSFSGPMVGMAIQNSICSPDYSGGVNMDHSVSILGVASSIAHELGHSLGLDHDPPGNSCPCPGPAPAKSCIMEASTDFLPGLNFGNCSRQALERALLDGMGSCLFEQLPRLSSMATVHGNKMVELSKQHSCDFPDDCADPCCDYVTCQLRPGAQCASDGPCCHNCQLRPAGWPCRPKRGDCDLPEFCPGDSPQCPPDVSLGDGEPCDGAQAVCVRGRCASYAQQCQALWGPGAQPAAPPCLLAANTRGDAFGSCGRGPAGSYLSCDPRDAVCGQLQCRGGLARPLLGSARDLHWEVLDANGTRLNCSWVHLDLGTDVAQPLLALPGTACGPSLVCDSNKLCHCEEGWAPPDCRARIRASRSLTTGLLLSLLLLLILVLLGASYWYRARLRQRLCQLKGPSCQYRAAQPGPPERPGPPQRAQLMPGVKQASALGFPAPPSRPLPPDPVPKRLQRCSSLGDQGAPQPSDTLSPRSSKGLRGLPSPRPRGSHSRQTPRACVLQVTSLVQELESRPWWYLPGLHRLPQLCPPSTSDLFWSSTCLQPNLGLTEVWAGPWGTPPHAPPR
ncbi:disintegrin and metalloproteinase domain-containing protein 15 isoform X4 [Pipistrellus kuhlii]|uniref:disintegrin and metalloproteinase domain-containing protein 15 isoform X4 n=1 Tax=Pipistrellus kuhlii TaxID=59472 RepID=UPI00174F0658|nr:disintegrin and metalloproteinase domain-containing protein 15 isoform X4 [Pipistrellus kuhlii]